MIQSPPGCLQWFPQQYWESEFFLAQALGYNFIEFIGEREHNKDNPVWSDAGIKRMVKLCEINNLLLYSFCDDFVVNHSIKDKDTQEHALEFISRGSKLNMRLLVLPLFEKSEITKNNYREFKDPLLRIANHAKKYDITICVESLLDSACFSKLIDYLKHSNVQCVFDTGNRIAAGQDIYSDILKLNKHIAHVHIKDKNLDGENVLLGTGNVNFMKVFKSLKAIKYKGNFTYETFRGKNPKQTARFNRFFIDFFIQEA